MTSEDWRLRQQNAETWPEGSCFGNRARKDRREFEASRAVLPRGTVSQAGGHEAVDQWTSP